MSFLECILDWCNRNHINMNDLTLVSAGSDNRYGNGEGMYFTKFDYKDGYVIFGEWNQKHHWIWIVWED